jgi:hypothetical protein
MPDRPVASETPKILFISEVIAFSVPIPQFKRTKALDTLYLGVSSIKLPVAVCPIMPVSL